MPRSDDDTWDLATSVGATATLVAAARVLAGRQDDPLVQDPFAEPLVRAVGIEAFTRVLDGRADLTGAENAGMLVDLIAVRTRFFDDFFTAAGAVGVRQAVILAAGLDSRAYRLPWPAGTTVFEIDRPEVVEFKTRVLTRHGTYPAATSRPVGVDLREDWAGALRAHGFDDNAPTAWIAEGLLIYLPPDAQDRLFATITGLSAPGSWLATEYHPDGGSGIAERSAGMSAELARQGLDLKLGDLFYPGQRRSVVEHLESLGWDLSSRSRPEMFAAYGRDFPEGPDGDPLRNSLSVTATRKAAL